MFTRLLIVEDDPLQQDVLESFFKGHRYYVETTSSGVDAVSRARNGWFHVVIMDYNLAEADGLAAARLIRSMGRGSRVSSIVALTASPERVRALDDGEQPAFDAVETKPCNLPRLLSLVETLSLHSREAPSANFLTPLDGVCAPPDVTGASRILVVEDDDMIRDIITAALHAAGHHVTATADGLEGATLISEGGFDAAVLDYCLPGITGLAAARIAHGFTASLARPRLIALTANPDRLAEQERGRLPVFDDVLSKAGGIGPLIEAVERSLAYRRHAAERGGTTIAELSDTLDILELGRL